MERVGAAVEELEVLCTNGRLMRLYSTRQKMNMI